MILQFKRFQCFFVLYNLSARFLFVRLLRFSFLGLTVFDAAELLRMFVLEDSIAVLGHVSVESK